MTGVMLALAAVGGLTLGVLTFLVFASGLRTVAESRAALIAWSVAVACTFLSLGIAVGTPQ